MTDENTHASRITEQLRILDAEDDEGDADA
jgi:hypothetical protein